MSTEESDWLSQGTVFTYEAPGEFDYLLGSNDSPRSHMSGPRFTRLDRVISLIGRILTESDNQTDEEVNRSIIAGLGQFHVLPQEIQEHIYRDVFEEGDLNIIPRHDWYRYSYTRRRFRQGELHYQLAVPTLFRNGNDSASATPPGGCLGEIIQICEPVPPIWGIRCGTNHPVRHGRHYVRVSGCTTSARKHVPPQSFPEPSTNNVGHGLGPSAQSGEDEEATVASDDTEDDPELVMIWRDFQQRYHLAERLMRPHSLQEVRLVVHADTDNPDYSAIDLVYLGDQIGRTILAIRTKNRVTPTIEITVRNTAGIDRPSLNLLMVSMTRAQRGRRRRRLELEASAD